MKVFVAGGTGFVGSSLVNELISKGHTPVLLARKPGGQTDKKIETIIGDALKGDTLSGKLENIQAVINLIGIIREFPARGITYNRFHLEATRNIAKAAKEAGIKRWVQMSANGAKPDGVSDYQTSKFRAEEFLKSEGFDLTIFRPSLIFGSPEGGRIEFCTQMADMLRPLPAIPIFGDGSYRFQPIYAGDVASAFVGSLENLESVGKIFHLGGDQTFSYKELLDIISQGAGISKRIKIPVPYFLARPFIKLLGRFSFFPATVDQIDMLVEGNTVPETSYKEAFGIKPKEINGENLSYLKKG